MRIKVPVVQASFFGMVLGLAGLGTVWRWAHQVWGLPAVVGERSFGFQSPYGWVLPSST